MEYLSRISASTVSESATSAAAVLGVDQLRDPVYLHGRVIPSPAFAMAMLVLGRVVPSNFNPPARDNSDYQRWVQGEYLKDIDSGPRRESLARIVDLTTRRAELSDRLVVLSAETKELASLLDRALDGGVPAAKARFWRWLYSHDREAWLVLDPIVSVQPDRTFFEAFSNDESTYVRVTLPHAALDAPDLPRPGTTNIDFSVALEREFARVRTYRPLTLTVGASSVSVDTAVSQAVEKRIDLPDSWVSGLVEVQAAQTLGATELTLSARTLGAAIAFLKRHKDPHGPRSIAFHLDPGSPVTLDLEPWGERFVDDHHVFTGEAPEVVRVWGRRRLTLLARMLDDTDTVSVRLLGSGMPSFWAVEQDGIQLQLGLSGWSRRDWASRARFAALMPSSDADPALLETATALLSERYRLTVGELVATAGADASAARRALNRMCVTGRALYDAGEDTYWHRILFPGSEPVVSHAGLEERLGLQLHSDGAAEITTSRSEAGLTVSEGVCVDSARSRTFHLVHRTDSEALVRYAQCDCPHFRYHKLRNGPCRHIVAFALLVGGAR